MEWYKAYALSHAHAYKGKAMEESGVSRHKEYTGTTEIDIDAYAVEGGFRPRIIGHWSDYLIGAIDNMVDTAKDYRTNHFWG